ncbi:MAG: SDR family oxidoreductase [bacterium]
MATILLTGVTGTVGSSLAPLLIERGHKLVCLIRGGNPVARLERAVGRADGITVLNGDVTLLNLGLSEREARVWKRKIDKVVNCAASIQLDGGEPEATLKVNVTGVKNLLGFAKDLSIPEFHQVSTAYVAGDADYFSEDDFDTGQNSRNFYEKTKREAEQLLLRWRYGKFSIYRLGIVVGDYQTGYTQAFNGYYVFASSLWSLRNSLAVKPKEEMAQYLREGVGFDLDGLLVLPIYLNFAYSSTLNIVPVDWAAETMAGLVSLDAEEKVFHVVHPRPKKARWVNNISLRRLGVKGFYYGDYADYSSRSNLSRLQKVFDRRTQQYLPYITHECRFEVANALYALKERYKPPPEIDEMFLFTILDYAKSVDFGRQKPEPKAVMA